MRYRSLTMRGSPITSSLPSWITNVFIGTVIIIIFIAFISGIIYSATAPRSGTVEGTWLEPAHMETYQSGSICYSRDRDGWCTFSMPVYSDRWVPDRCYLSLNDKEVSKRKATWNIPCYEKDTYKVGTFVNLGD
jgi:hypothetical protein